MSEEDVAMSEQYTRALHEFARKAGKDPVELGGDLIRYQLEIITQPKGNAGKVQPFRRRAGPEKGPKRGQ